MARKPRKRSSILAKDFTLDMSEVEIVFDEFAEDSYSRFPQHNESYQKLIHREHLANGEAKDAGEVKEKEEDDDDKHAKRARQLKKKDEFNDSSHSISTHSTFKRAYDSFRQVTALSFKSIRVDAFLAAFGCAGSLALLQFLTGITPYEFNGSFLVGSSIKFFFNENPPSLKACVHSSMFAVVIGHTLHFVPHFCGQYARPVLLFATVLYWKLYGGMWTAANTLSMIVAVESGGWASVVPNIRELNAYANSHQEQANQKRFPWMFLFFPYISGHIILYCMATAMSFLRRKIRTYLIQREFITKQMGYDWQTEIVGGAERRERLRQLFNRMDTSGDGQLDVIELQVALRAVTVTDISLGDTKEILNSVDSDGNGSVDFDEFCASIDKLWPE